LISFLYNNRQSRGEKGSVGKTASWDVSELPGIDRPVEKGLSLPPPAPKVEGMAILFNLGDMAGYSFPAPDLPLVVRAAPPQEISAVPLEPASRVLEIDPSFHPPVGEWF